MFTASVYLINPQLLVCTYRYICQVFITIYTQRLHLCHTADRNLIHSIFAFFNFSHFFVIFSIFTKWNFYWRIFAFFRQWRSQVQALKTLKREIDCIISRCNIKLLNYQSCCHSTFYLQMGMKDVESCGEEKSRDNGWSLPLYPLQVVAWIILVIFSVLYFVCFVPVVHKSWQPAAYIVSFLLQYYCFFSFEELSVCVYNSTIRTLG